MQCSPPFFVAGPPNCLQFYPCTTPSYLQNYTTPSPPLQNYTTPSPPLPSFPQMYQTCNFQSYNGPVSNVVGEGDVAYVVLPDGTIQLFFFPATSPRCGRCLQNNAAPGWNNNTTNNGPWFIRSVNTNVDRSQQQRLPPQPYGSSNDYSQNNLLSPYPETQKNRGLKFHNDRCTSSEDLGYFCRSKLQRHDAYFPSKCSTSVQVSRDPAHVAQPQVCDAPCKCPHNCAGKPPVFEGIFGRYDSDMSVSETRRGEKRGKSPYSDSPCTSCERNRKRRKYVISSDSNSSDLSSGQWQWERKRQKQDYKDQRRERQKELKELEKEIKERAREKKKQDKEFEKFLKESEKRKKESEKEERKFREKEIKNQIHLQDSQMDNRQNNCKLCDKQMNQLRENPRPVTQDSGSTNCSNCVLCKLPIAESSSNTNPCNVEYPNSYEKECKKLFDKELKRREAVRVKSEKSLEKLRKTELKMSDQELKKRESQCKKIEAAIQKKIQSDKKKMEQEQIKNEKERRKAERLRKKQGNYGENEIGDSSSTDEIKQPDCHCFLSASTPSVKKQSNTRIKDLLELECSCTASLMSEDKSNKERPLQVDISEHPCQGCDNYCNKARASGKTSTTHMQQADKSNADEVLKLIMFKCSQPCNTDLNPPDDLRKDCGILCEGPTKANKEIETHTDQANSGIFGAIINKFGIGIQCSKCAPPPPPGTDAPGADAGDPQSPFEIFTRASDGNLTICARTNPSCNPL